MPRVPRQEPNTSGNLFNALVGASSLSSAGTAPGPDVETRGEAPTRLHRRSQLAVLHRGRRDRRDVGGVGGCRAQDLSHTDPNPKPSSVPSLDSPPPLDPPPRARSCARSLSATDRRGRPRSRTLRRCTPRALASTIPARPMCLVTTCDCDLQPSVWGCGRLWKDGRMWGVGEFLQRSTANC